MQDYDSNMQKEVVTAQSNERQQQEQQPTILVVHASAGSGHRSAALSTAEAFEILLHSTDPEMLQGLSIPENTKIEILDIFDFGRIMFDGNKVANMFIGSSRFFYDYTWRYLFTGRILWGGGTIWDRIMYPKFTEMVKRVKPVAIVCTHITAANCAISARMLSGQNYPVLCVPTDYAIEGLWPHRTGNLFCVANETMAETLRPRKVPNENIQITGIPTRDDFRKEYDSKKVRSELGLPPDKLVVLVLAGAYLPQPYLHFREAIDKMLPYINSCSNMHFVFIAGNDIEYSNHLEKLCEEHDISNATIVDYVNEMAALMAASDLAICKSGGLTVTECLCARLPIILLGRTYGQEKSNRVMLTAKGAALHVTTPSELLETIQYVSRNPKQIEGMIISGGIMRCPDASLDIARATFRLIEEGNLGAIFKTRRRFVWFYWGKRPAHSR